MSDEPRLVPERHEPGVPPKHPMFHLINIRAIALKTSTAAADYVRCFDGQNLESAGIALALFYEQFAELHKEMVELRKIEEFYRANPSA